MEPGKAPWVTYAMDPRASQFTVQAFASGLISVVAHSPKIAIRDWTAEAQFVPGTLANANLKVKVKASSLEVVDEIRESDRRELHRVMYNEVLETGRFPDIAFDSSQIRAERQKEDLYRVSVDGTLSLHGVTRPHSFFGQVAFGVDSFRAYGEFTLLQSEFNIRIASIAGGTMKLQDEVKFSFYVVARSRAA
jgi:polyisoprenoid-binding protein YceI